MRALAICLFALAVVLAIDSARDLHRGVAKASAPRMLIPAMAIRAQDPEGFCGLMAYEWIRVALCTGAGITFWQIASRSRQLDPFSPNAP